MDGCVALGLLYSATVDDQRGVFLARTDGCSGTAQKAGGRGRRWDGGVRCGARRAADAGRGKNRRAVGAFWVSGWRHVGRAWGSLRRGVWTGFARAADGDRRVVLVERHWRLRAVWLGPRLFFLLPGLFDFRLPCWASSLGRAQRVGKGPTAAARPPTHPLRRREPCRSPWATLAVNIEIPPCARGDSLPTSVNPDIDRAYRWTAWSITHRYIELLRANG